MPETPRMVRLTTGCETVLTTRGVKLAPHLDADGRAVLMAITSDGRRVAERAVPADGTISEIAAAVDALRAILNAHEPVPLVEPEPFRLVCAPGGNKPPRGRPRKRRPMTVVAGGLATRRAGRRA